MIRIKNKTLTIENPETHELSIAVDNLVCCECKQPLIPDAFSIISHPRGKGLVAFCCREHTQAGMDLLSKALDL